ncbi:MAG: hypothetical protein DMF69_20550 [Acidobacteria bacterium]|nr:MAG: hypothetical protein DMF69_20550 [Acidobacteriota bacterium]
MLTVEQLKAEIMDLSKAADEAGVGSEIYKANTDTVTEKIRELKALDPEAAKETIGDLMEMRTGVR